MRIRKLLTITAIIGLLCCYGCGGADTGAKVTSTETSVSQIASTETSEASIEAAENVAEEESYPEEDTEAETYAGESEGSGKIYSKVEVTGIEEWDAVGYSIAGFLDGSLFSTNYVDADGTQISGDYSPGTPDKFVFEFGPVGEITSAVYYGTYPDAETVALGIEACNTNADLMGGDIIAAYGDGETIMIYLDPHSARFNNTIRTYFLEGYHDPAGYTASVEKSYDSTTRDKSTLKGDNFACDVIQGIKVTWYE